MGGVLVDRDNLAGGVADEDGGLGKGGLAVFPIVLSLPLAIGRILPTIGLRLRNDGKDRIYRDRQ